ncbi:suppressor of fused domain protein [Roseiflexus castenholzii]|jgi:hypothetical protein|uniref:Suppressor of fused-like domain-containing protein n=1 Tax=Roseiflexus castenholzii (strain DSM 13941 / HLO8) TaxID=383372 RepID=A7NKR7_ROSCS|nr:suppressor of fused domain protein [Roseiflexus castenholzii]ABU58087.1 conserved hypothetical protein [Roseiflexus castenholzii DSM 13941]
MTFNLTQFRAALDAAYVRDDDPTALMFDHYLRWKGSPSFIARPVFQEGMGPMETLVSRHFTVLAYQANPLYTTLCTLGASYRVIPFSRVSFGDERGVRYEYIMHAARANEQQAAELLALVAEYPFVHNVEIGPGYVMPVGEPVAPGSPMEYLYFTYPYLDDSRMYESNPWGEIERPELLIQVLWVLPIYRSEAQFIRIAGMEAFEGRLQERHAQIYDAYDLMRLPLVEG